MRVRFGPLFASCSGDPAAAAPPVVLLHGLGLGPWLWEPWFPLFVEAGLCAIALELPGHDGSGQDVGLADVVAGVGAALDALPGPVTLVGHSFAGLVAQIVAAQRPLAALGLVCPLPPGQVAVSPSGWALAHSVPLALALARRRPLRVGFPAHRALGLHALSESAAREVYRRIQPFPNRLCRDLLFARPVVDPDAIHAPVLVALGRQDRMISWKTARLLGDLYEGVVWRYDDLSHTPPWEPGGERMGRDLAGWCAAPSRPQVLESEGFTPTEGVGHVSRRARRGEEMKKRSAYGQRGSAR